MRDFALVGAIIIALGITLFHPFAGVILWTWFAVQNPHEEAWSFSHALPLNLIIAAVDGGGMAVFERTQGTAQSAFSSG